MPTLLRCVSVAYVAAVAALTAKAFSSPDPGFTWTEATAMLATLPAILGAMPVVYLGGALIWNLTGADDGGPMWPVTLVYTVIFAGAAVANLWLVRALVHVLRPRSSDAL